MMNACCQNPDNRTTLETTPQGLTIQRCNTCDRKHYEIAVDPATIGIKVT